jgi:hypothetical protein
MPRIVPDTCRRSRLLWRRPWRRREGTDSPARRPDKTLGSSRPGRAEGRSPHRPERGTSWDTRLHRPARKRPDTSFGPDSSNRRQRNPRNLRAPICSATPTTTTIGLTMQRSDDVSTTSSQAFLYQERVQGTHKRRSKRGLSILLLHHHDRVPETSRMSVFCGIARSRGSPSSLMMMLRARLARRVRGTQATSHACSRRTQGTPRGRVSSFQRLPASDIARMLAAPGERRPSLIFSMVAGIAPRTRKRGPLHDSFPPVPLHSYYHPSS